MEIAKTSIYTGVPTANSLQSGTSYTSVFSNGVLQQNTAGVNITVSPAAKLMEQVDTLNQKLDAYTKAMQSGDLSLTASALVAIKQQILNLKVMLQNMQSTFEMEDQIMDILNKMLKKADNLKAI